MTEQEYNKKWPDIEILEEQAETLKQKLGNLYLSPKARQVVNQYIKVKEAMIKDLDQTIDSMENDRI